jgi:hypothetical protein
MFSATAEPAEFLLAGEHAIFVGSCADVAGVLGACFDSGGLILTERDVSADFFVLASGLAGELFQKFTNYRVPLVVVVSDFGRYGERFAELAREHAAHNAIRFVHTVDEAKAWLSSLADGSAAV